METGWATYYCGVGKTFVEYPDGTAEWLAGDQAARFVTPLKTGIMAPASCTDVPTAVYEIRATKPTGRREPHHNSSANDLIDSLVQTVKDLKSEISELKNGLRSDVDRLRDEIMLYRQEASEEMLNSAKSDARKLLNDIDIALDPTKKYDPLGICGSITDIRTGKKYALGSGVYRNQGRAYCTEGHVIIKYENRSVDEIRTITIPREHALVEMNY